MSADDIQSAAQWLGALISAALAVIYAIHQALTRLAPPHRRGMDRPSVELSRIADALHQASVSLQHTATVQDEIAASIREDRRVTAHMVEVLSSVSAGQIQLHELLRHHDAIATKDHERIDDELRDLRRVTR